MNQKLLPAIIVVGIFALAFSILGFLISGHIANRPIDEPTNISGQAGQPIDLFGTQTGTTTSATADVTNLIYTNSDFSDVSLQPYVTSSVSVLLDGQTDTAVITMEALTASSTSYFTWDIYGSNDTGCNSMATSTTDDRYVATLPIISEVNWFPADPANTRTLGILDPFGTSSSTSVLLTNLNWKCLQLNLHGASTTVWSQIKQKSFK